MDNKKKMMGLWIFNSLKKNMINKYRIAKVFKYKKVYSLYKKY